jgi:hypothetical protein
MLIDLHTHTWTEKPDPRLKPGASSEQSALASEEGDPFDAAAFRLR